MPVIEINLRDLEKLVGKKLPRDADELWDKYFSFIKAGLGELSGDEAKLELEDGNRPDLWSVEGVARSLKTMLGVKNGLLKYPLKLSNKKIIVKEKVKKVRPYIAAAIVKGLSFSDESIKQLIQTQEKIDEVYGRKRKKAAIGVYDVDKITFPVTYTTFADSEIEFVPLGFSKKMSPRGILREHPKGIAYASALEGAKEFPILIDKAKKVLSMPPIINSNDLGKVTEKTRNVFVEVTGTHSETVLNTLNFVVLPLADRGGAVESLKISYDKKSARTPDFSPRKMSLFIENIHELLGMDFSASDVKRLLLKAGFGIKPATKKKITVLVPCYRSDVMHEVDIIEDIAIAYGYNNITPKKPMVATVGSFSPLSRFANTVRQLLVGLAMQEVQTFTLTSKEVLIDNVNRAEVGLCEIENPMSLRYCVLRDRIFPTLIELLSRNTHLEYPQNVFEVGDVVVAADSPSGTETKRSACAILCGADSDFTKAKSALDFVMASLGIPYSLEEERKLFFIPGRSAKILVGEKEVGEIGEVRPEILERQKISMPMSAFEIDLTKIHGML